MGESRALNITRMGDVDLIQIKEDIYVREKDYDHDSINSIRNYD